MTESNDEPSSKLVEKIWTLDLVESDNRTALHQGVETHQPDIRVVDQQEENVGLQVAVGLDELANLNM